MPEGPDFPTRSTRSTGNGLTVVQRIQAIESDLRYLQTQRDREHRDNQVILSRIDEQGRRTGDAVARIESTVAQHDERIEDIEEWRKGLSAEIRGALKIPKVLLAAMPVVVVVLAIWQAIKP